MTDEIRINAIAEYKRLIKNERTYPVPTASGQNSERIKQVSIGNTPDRKTAEWIKNFFKLTEEEING